MTSALYERLAADLARCRDELLAEAAALEEEVRRLREQARPALARHARATREAYDALFGAVESHPEHFGHPKSRVTNGIRYGWQKQRGRISWDDDAAVIRRIRELLPPTQQRACIRTVERLDRAALAEMTEATLRRLGVRVTEDSDVPFVRTVDREAERTVRALLAETE